MSATKQAIRKARVAWRKSQPRISNIPIAYDPSCSAPGPSDPFRLNLAPELEAKMRAWGERVKRDLIMYKESDLTDNNASLKWIPLEGLE